MTPLPPIIARLKAASAKATKGPLVVWDDALNERWKLTTKKGTNGSTDDPSGAQWVASVYEEEDAYLIALTRNSIDPLLKAFEAAMEEIAYWRKIAVDDCDGIPEDAPDKATDLALRELGEAQ